MKSKLEAVAVIQAVDGCGLGQDVNSQRQQEEGRQRDLLDKTLNDVTMNWLGLMYERGHRLFVGFQVLQLDAIF